ncbi:hypothetical protein Anas_06870 [Armadillidium nasatum]|uniref:Uncharacterized protein n=1 Tax=Armadillidium nasatum TaxID=96803 RepID=A0A5N5T2Z4_9CRUS|nr:hypothetical protein Anas_06870 [Armadillidium nasatum]
MFVTRNKIILFCLLMLSIGIFNSFFTNDEINFGFQPQIIKLIENTKKRTEEIFIKESVLSEEKKRKTVKALKTSCSKEAENVGLHQKVISYSFLNKKASYSRGLNHLPAPIYSLWALPVTMWRFAPLGDDQVDVVLSRDLDSLDILWPAFKNDFLAHDSYHCDLFPGSVPFPTRRDGTKYIGDQTKLSYYYYKYY